MVLKSELKYDSNNLPPFTRLKPKTFKTFTAGWVDKPADSLPGTVVCDFSREALWFSRSGASPSGGQLYHKY